MQYSKHAGKSFLKLTIISQTNATTLDLSMAYMSHRTLGTEVGQWRTGKTRLTAISATVTASLGVRQLWQSQMIMKRETITISVPPRMKRYIMALGSSEFGSVSEYIRKLIRQDQNFRRCSAEHKAIMARRESIAR